MNRCKIRWVGTLFLTLATLAAAEPQAGDADFPTRNGNPRHEEKVVAVKAGNYDLVLIGDSITHSLGELNDGKYAPNQAVWNRHFAPRHAMNLGMNGQRTEEILWNLQHGELDFAKSPKVVMLLIGTNNCDDRNFARVHTPEQILAGTKAIVDLIRQRHPATKILVLRIFPRGGDNEKSVSPPAFNSSPQCIETCRRAGELTAKLADGEHVFWLDVNHVFLRPDGTINTDLMWDLLHPSPAGAEAWVRAVEPTLARLMGDKVISGYFASFNFERLNFVTIAAACLFVLANFSKSLTRPRRRSFDCSAVASAGKVGTGPTRPVGMTADFLCLSGSQGTRHRFRYGFTPLAFFAKKSLLR